MAKQYDLEERTLEFLKKTIRFCKQLPTNTINNKLVGQLVNSSGSVGANYIEANEALSKKDFTYRIKICRKEAKESRFWFKALVSANPACEKEAIPLMDEALEFIKIFTAILGKCE
jgi:four helix bundle protein